MSQPSDVHLCVIPASSSFSSADQLNWNFGGTDHLAVSDRWTTMALFAVLVLLRRPARPIPLLAPKLARENLTSPKRKRWPVLLYLFLRLDEHRRTERLDEWICPEEFIWMDACMHVCICVRVLDQAVPWHTQSPASRCGVSVQACVQTTLVSRVMGHFWARDNPHAVRVSGYQRFCW